MHVQKKRYGFTLVELLLFMGLSAIMGTTLISVYIATQEARLRQQGIAAVEQRGTQILEMIVKNVRRGEKILAPLQGKSGAVLTLQMGLNSEFPTIFGRTVSGQLLLIQKTSTAALLSPKVTISKLLIKNIEGKSVQFTFSLTAAIPSVPPQKYTKEFAGTATLYVDDQSDAGGCGSCAVPVCTAGTYQWFHCVSDTCLSDSEKLMCP